MDLINGSGSTVRLSNDMVLPGNGAVARGLGFAGVMLSGPGMKPVALGEVYDLLAQGRTWAAPKGGAAAFFKVADVGSGAPGVYFTTSRAVGASPGPYRHPVLGLQYFNPSPGATVPSGFEPAGAASSPSQHETRAAAALSAARLELTDPSAAVPPCETVPVELYSLNRLFSQVRLAQAQGDAPPVRLRPATSTPGDGVLGQVEFLPCVAAARPAGFAALAGCGATSSAQCAAQLAQVPGGMRVSGPPRPQDLIPTRSAADEGPVWEMPTHPLATTARPLGFGQLRANLTSVSDTEIARKEAVARHNYMMDRYADLRIQSSATM